MKYSIIMPVFLHDADHRIIVQDTIDSIKANTNWDEAELIIVDDGSTISTQFLQHEVGTYIRHNPLNKGIAPSWNDGLSVARGEFVVIINDDIQVPQGWLDKLAEAFENPDCGVSGPSNAGPTELPRFVEGNIFKNHKFFPGYCYMFKRDRFLERFDEQFIPFNYEDTDMWVRVEATGLNLYKVPMAIWHAEGDTIHKMQYEQTSSINHQKFIDKHGFDPQKEYYSW